MEESRLTFDCQEPRDRVCLITVSGWVSASGVDRFEKFFLPLMKDKRYDECILDCRGVEYISSIGLRVFMKAIQLRRTEKKSPLICRLVANSMLHKSLIMVGFSNYLTIRT